MIFWEIAKRNIRLHFLRSSLAMLGIVIGVVAIASMGILGNSLVATVSDSLSSVGDSVIVTPYTGGGGMGMGGGGGASSANLKITDQQFQQIKRAVAPGVAIPVLSTAERMKVGVGGDDIVATVYGIDPQYIPDLNLVLTSGGFNNANSGCLVGSQFAKDHNIKVGSRISMGSDGGKGTLRVTGIIEERGMAFDVSTDNAVVATQDWFDNTYNRDNYDQVVVKVKSGQDTAVVKTIIEKQLNKRDKIVSVMDSKATLATIFQTFGAVTTFVTAIGGISMVVAGCLDLQYHDDVGQRADQGDRHHAQHRYPEERGDEHVHLRGRDHRGDRKFRWGYPEPSRGICHQRPDAPDNQVPVHRRDCDLRDRRCQFRDSDLPCLRYLPGMAGSEYEPHRCPPARIIFLLFSFRILHSREPFYGRVHTHCI